MKTLYNNEVLNATITASSENPSYDFTTAFNDTRLSRVGRTTAISSQWIKFVFASAITIDYVAILAHNLTAGATVVLQGNSSDSWTSPTFTQSLTITDSIVQHFTSKTYRYWRITITDSSNADGYIEIGNVFLTTGLSWPAANLDSIRSLNTNSTASKSVSMQLYGDKKTNFSGFEISFDSVTNAQKILLEAMFRDVDIIKPFILLFWENNLDVEPPLYCNFIQGFSWTLSSDYSVLWSFTATFEQCF
jgi:hypothetical protein